MTWKRRQVLEITLGVLLTIVALPGCGGSSHHRAARVPAEPPAVPAPASTAFGANVNSLFNAPLYAPVQVSAQVAALRATGATVGRSDALWEKVEQAPPNGGVHHYDWSFDDAIAVALAARGLTWLPILDYAANWAKAVPSQLHSPPRSAALFATFARAFAARYGPGGTLWRMHQELTPQPVRTFEIWNEPDGGFWYPAPNPAAFADLYLQARSAIDAVAPGSRVVVGGLTHADIFLPAMLAVRPQLANHVDGVGVHLYNPNPSKVLARVRTIRSVLDEHGFAGTPLYITEFGWSTHPASRSVNEFFAPASARPSYIADVVRTLGHSDCDIGAILVYSWVTPRQNKTNLEDWFGINAPPPHVRQSPDAQAFSTAIRAASRSGSPARVCVRSG